MELSSCFGQVKQRLDLKEQVIGLKLPKTDAGNLFIDVYEEFCSQLQRYLAGRTSGVVFLSEWDTPLRPGNVLKRWLHPILKKLGIPLGGKLTQCFPHGRVTVLRKNKTPADLQKLWIGHTTLEMTDQDSRTTRKWNIASNTW